VRSSTACVHNKSQGIDSLISWLVRVATRDYLVCKSADDCEQPRLTRHQYHAPCSWGLTTYTSPLHVLAWGQSSPPLDVMFILHTGLHFAV
jgi:hypothetical protein